MTLRERTYTRDDLRAIASLPENANKRFELYRGVIYEVPSGTPLHAWIISTLVRIIGNFVFQHRLGYVFADSIEFDLPNGDTFIPDVSFVSNQRQPELPKAFNLSPDLAVEVYSPSNYEREMMNKVESYLECGTQRVWVIYPEEQIIDVYRRTANGDLLIQKFTIDSTLDGEDVLPGFKLMVRDVFPQ
ncbi:MAG: Uma2 family endonuclease [Anaerolineae bacterium]|nr:Uma2 family endonuclease [Anaerolineae bacterium]